MSNTREIKFRAWDGAGMNKWDWFTKNYKTVQWLEHNSTDTWEVMQYTGLDDKNGMEIYEGDILDDGGVVEFRTDLRWDGGGSPHSGYFSTNGYQYKDDGDLSYHYDIGELEVIGNMYENPELLKASDV